MWEKWGSILKLSSEFFLFHSLSMCVCTHVCVHMHMCVRAGATEFLCIRRSPYVCTMCGFLFLLEIWGKITGFPVFKKRTYNKKLIWICTARKAAVKCHKMLTKVTMGVSTDCVSMASTSNLPPCYTETSLKYYPKKFPNKSFHQSYQMLIWVIY